MPGRLSYNGIHIDFQNEWARFDDPINSIVSSKQTRSGIVEVNKFFDQQIIATSMRFSPGQDEIQIRRLFEFANAGATFELWRDRDLGTYISFEGGGNSATVPTITPRGLQTNDLVAGTFTRAGTADSSWFLDPSTGLVTVSPSTTANIPRFEAGKYGQHAIRIDGAAANLITHPSAIDNAAWTKSNITVGANTSETLDPSGASTADKITSTAAGGNISFDTATAVGNDAALGVWLKSPSGDVSGNLDIRGTTAGDDQENITITPEWQRFGKTSDTSTGGYLGNLRFRVRLVDNTEDIYVWDAAGYDSAEFDFGTVGALSTAAVTRGQEKLTFLSANIINKEKGSIGMWVKPAFTATGHPVIMFFASEDSGGAAGDRHLQVDMPTAGNANLRLFIRRDNTTTTGLSLSVSLSALLTQDTWHHLGATWDSTISNGGKLYWDGALIGTSSNSAFNISDAGDTIAVGNVVAGGVAAYSAIDEIVVRKEVMPDSWFQQRFSSRFAIGEGRNYWASVRLSNLNYARQALRGGRSTIPLEFEEVLT